MRVLRSRLIRGQDLLTAIAEMRELETRSTQSTKLTSSEGNLLVYPLVRNYA